MVTILRQLIDERLLEWWRETGFAVFRHEPMIRVGLIRAGPAFAIAASISSTNAGFSRKSNTESGSASQKPMTASFGKAPSNNRLGRDERPHLYAGHEARV